MEDHELPVKPQKLQMVRLAVRLTLQSLRWEFLTTPLLPLAGLHIEGTNRSGILQAAAVVLDMADN